MDAAESENIKREWRRDVSEHLPSGFRVQAVEIFDANHQIGVAITRVSDDEKPRSERRYWASRAPLGADSALDVMMKGLARAWVSDGR